MSSWLNDYIATLEIRDSREKADEGLYLKYAKLADHTATAQKQLPRDSVAQPTAPESPRSSTPTKNLGKTLKRADSTATPSAAPADELGRLRTDLATSNRRTSALQAQVQTLIAERDGLLASARTLAQRDRDVQALERKLRDREEELKAKLKLMETMQDELVGLEMQVNVFEEKYKQLERENKDLVDRWMRRMGREADQMNKEGGWTE